MHPLACRPRFRLPLSVTISWISKVYLQHIKPPRPVTRFSLSTAHRLWLLTHPSNKYRSSIAKALRPRVHNPPSPPTTTPPRVEHLPTHTITRGQVNVYNTMVSRAYYPPPHPHPHEGARYMSSRSCAPYYSYPDRRYQLPSHDARAVTMTDPQADDTTPPRKRIAVAVSPGFFFTYICSLPTPVKQTGYGHGQTVAGYCRTPSPPRRVGCFL